MAGPEYIVYSDDAGHEFTETCTSPIAATFREEELEAQGFHIIGG